MKKILLTALAFISVHSVFGLSIERPLLRMEETPLAMFQPVASGEREGLLVRKNGDVVVYECSSDLSPVGALECEQEVVDTLSKREVRKIKRLIKYARYGKLVDPNPSGITCLAIPTRSKVYSARDSITLSSGSYPCGGSMVNNSKSAQKLVDLLNDLSH